MEWSNFRGFLATRPSAITLQFYMTLAIGGALWWYVVDEVSLPYGRSPSISHTELEQNLDKPWKCKWINKVYIHEVVRQIKQTEIKEKKQTHAYERHCDITDAKLNACSNKFIGYNFILNIHNWSENLSNARSLYWQPN